MFDSYRSSHATRKIVVPGMIRRPIDLHCNYACRIFEIEISENFERFPETGFVVNNVSSLIFRTLEGRFSLEPKNKEMCPVWEDGYVYIPKGEPFFIRRNLTRQKYAKFSVTAIPFCYKGAFEFVS